MATHLEDPFSRPALLELRLFSTVAFIAAAMVLQFLVTAETGILLKIFSYQFNYSIFSLEYVDETSEPWTEAMVTFVFGSGPLMLTILGFWFLSALVNSSVTNWRVHLALTWLTFLMVNAVPCGIMAGFLSFDSVGVVFHWLAGNYFIRGIIALGVFILLLYTGGFWLFQFLKTACHPAYIADWESRKLFFKNVFVLPWLYGLVILFVFNWPFNSIYWPVSLLSLGFITMMASNQLRAVPDLQITDPVLPVPSTRQQKLLVISALFVIWVINFISARF